MAASEIANVKAHEIAPESERVPPKYPMTRVTSANKKEALHTETQYPCRLENFDSVSHVAAANAHPNPNNTSGHRSGPDQRKNRRSMLKSDDRNQQYSEEKGCIKSERPHFEKTSEPATR